MNIETRVMCGDALLSVRTVCTSKRGELYITSSHVKVDGFPLQAGAVSFIRMPWWMNQKRREKFILRAALKHHEAEIVRARFAR